MTARSRKGWAIEMTEMATMIAVTTPTVRAWGRKRRGDPAHRHGGLGELGAVLRVDLLGRTAAAAGAAVRSGVVVSFKDSLHFRGLQVHDAEVTSL